MRHARDKNLRERIDNRRLQEMDIGEDGEGVDLDQSYFNDESYPTGAASLSRQRNRQVRIIDYASEQSEDEDDSENGIGGMQLVLRDKEDRLARKALERIRSAQMLGIKNVILTESEYDALESRKKIDEAAIVAAAPNSRTKGRRRDSVKSTDPARDERGSSVRIRTFIPNYENEEPPRRELATPPGVLVPGSGGSLSYRPLPVSAASERAFYRPSRSGSRSTSSHSQQPNIPPIRSNRYIQPEVGYPLADGPPRRSRVQPNHLSHRLRDDPTRLSRPRSASSQTYQPTLSQERPFYAEGQRNLSGLTEFHSIGSRRRNPLPMPHSSSEPSLSHREHLTSPNGEYLTDDENEDDDQSYGVQLNVAEYNQGYGTIDEREDYRRDWRKRSDP